MRVLPRVRAPPLPIASECDGGARSSKEHEQPSGCGASGGGVAGVASGAPGASGPAPAAKDEQKGWPSKRLPQKTRFFIMKSFCERDVKLSMQKGIWATQQRNETKLNQAFEVRVQSPSLRPIAQPAPN
eukprot:1422467-Prymnesium_polylepis.1